jgi:hypothetical protein
MAQKLKVDLSCVTCREGFRPKAECPKSEFTCGHHGNLSWTQDECEWCGKEFGEESVAELPERMSIEEWEEHFGKA